MHVKAGRKVKKKEDKMEQQAMRLDIEKTTHIFVGYTTYGGT